MPILLSTRHVVQRSWLIDKKVVIETEHIHYGGSKTQMSYEYSYVDGTIYPKERHKLDYWGRIEELNPKMEENRYV